MTVLRTISLRAACLVAVLAALAPAAHAAPICRWVDASGRIQLSDVVPKQYKNAAVCTDSQKYELTAEQEREAAETQSRARAQAAAQPAQPAQAPENPVVLAPPVAVKRPTEAITDATDCQSRWRIYEESLACFGPYQSAVTGAIKPEAFNACNVITSPEPACGPRRY